MSCGIVFFVFLRSFFALTSALPCGASLKLLCILLASYAFKIKQQCLHQKSDYIVGLEKVGKPRQP